MRKILLSLLIILNIYNLRSEDKIKTIESLFNKKMKTNNINFDVNKFNIRYNTSTNNTVEKYALDSIIKDFSKIFGPQSKSKITVEYDTNGNIISNKTYGIFDIQNNDYNLTEITKYKYNSLNQKIEETYSYYDNEFDRWYDSYIYEFIYNKEGLLSEKVIENSDGIDCN